MTAKRFTEIVSTQKVIDNQTGKEYHCLIDDDLLKLLNELHEENQMLNRLIEKRDGWNNLAHERIFQLEKENEQLKQQSRNAIKQIREDSATIFELEEEIKELKGDVE